MPTATCPVCGTDVTYTDRPEFRKHVDGHPRCGKCGQRFTSNTALGAHTLRCTGAAAAGGGGAASGTADPDDLPPWM